MSCKFKDFSKGDGIHPCCCITNGECQFLNEPFDSQCGIANAFKNLTLGVRFTAVKSGSTIKFNIGAVTGNYEYSLNNSKFIDYTIGDVITLLNVNDFVEFRAKTTNNTFCSNATSSNPGITMTGKIAASGNIQYLLDKDGNKLDVSRNCYKCMFYGCDLLISSPQLLATNLNGWCYAYMFTNCKNLIYPPPLLPAINATDNCYYRMFIGCISLIKAPLLAALTLANSCYGEMFASCTNLTEAPDLLATTLANKCYENIFKKCTNITKVRMKKSMSTVYDKTIHGDTTKEVEFTILD